MKLCGSSSTFYLLCLICLTDVLARRSRHDSSSEEAIAPVVEQLAKNISLDHSENLRDKRALGLILSGLAQVFGYTVSPVQLASLPNPNAAQSAPPAGPLVQRAGMPTTAATPASSGPPAAASARPPAQARQQETIRITGVVNFGNNSDLLGHLSQYERVFHGSATTASPPATSAAPQASPPAPTVLSERQEPETRPPLLTPFLVKIPLPLAPNVPPPLISAPKLEVPGYDDVLPPRKQQIPLPVPAPAPPRQREPVRNEQETEYRKNQNQENYSVENKEIYDEKDVRTPATENSYEEEPRWKQQHEDRLSSLERQQEQHEQRLQQQERDKSRDSNEDYREAEVNDKYRNREKEIDDREQEHISKFQEHEERRQPVDDDSRENTDSRENHENLEEVREAKEQPPSAGDSQEYEEERESYDEEAPPRGYKNDEESADREPKIIDNYTYLSVNDRLPIEEGYVKPTTDHHLRDSYGEILDNRGGIDERIASYFTMFKHPTTGVFDPQRIRNQYPSEEEQEGKRPALLQNEEEDEEGAEEPNARNKYEEYAIENGEEKNRASNEEEEEEEEAAPLRRPYPTPDPEEQEDYEDFQPRRLNIDTQDKRRNVAESHESVRTATTVLPKNFEDTGDRRVRGKSRTQAENPEEFRLITFSPYVKPIQYLYDPNEALKYKTEVNIAKQKSPRSENVDQQPKIGLPEKLSLKRLHEGEEKEVNLWPAPFDYVFDSTEQTNNIIHRGNSERDDKVTDAPVRQRSDETPYFRTEEVPYQGSDEISNEKAKDSSSSYEEYQVTTYTPSQAGYYQYTVHPTVRENNPRNRQGRAPSR